MERNTLTSPKELKMGDRFYKAKDSKKTVLQMVPHERKKTIYQTYAYWFITDTDARPQPIKYDTPVIFLRNVNDEPENKQTNKQTNKPVETKCLRLQAPSELAIVMVSPAEPRPCTGNCNIKDYHTFTLCLTCGWDDIGTEQH